MKTNSLRTVLVTGMIFAILPCATLASADAPKADRTERHFKGTLATLDPNEGTVAVKSFWRTRTFNLADDCKVSLEDKPQATVAELRPGQQVEIKYQNADGVLIARQINQHNLAFKGRVKAVEPNQRMLSVKRSGLTLDFNLASDCPILKQGESQTMRDLQVGEIVSVVYEPVGESRIARRIEQLHEEFAGTIRALDAETRTVKASGFLEDRKFNLADDCEIVIPGQPAAKLNGLRIGDRVSFSYEAKNGVLIAHRIGLEQPLASGDKVNAQASASGTR